MAGEKDDLFVLIVQFVEEGIFKYVILAGSVGQGIDDRISRDKDGVLVVALS